MSSVRDRTAQPRNRATAQPRNSAGSSFALNQSLSVVAGHRATILQPPAIIAGLPSAVAWSHPTTEGVPTSRPAHRPMERCRQHPGGGVRNNSK